MTGLGDTIRPAPMRTHSTTTSTMADEFCRIEVITGVGRRRRWSDEDKARIVAECLDPTTTVSAVAWRYGLHSSQLFVWRQQLAASDEEKHAANSERYCCARNSSRAKDLLPEQVHVILMLVVHPPLRRLEKERPRIRSLWPRS
jgi:transposase-like protein